jgi:outer membrane usher protein
VPGVRDVTTLWSNQEVGVTDRRGDYLVPNLLPYYGNQISIDEDDIPLDYGIERSARVIAVPYRGGAVVDFPVRRLQQVVGTVLLEHTGRREPASPGELVVQSAEAERRSPLGINGEFYFENLPAGHYEAWVESARGRCDFSLDVPESTGPLLKIGELVCASDPR